MENKPRIGLIWMRADWQGCNPAMPVLDRIKADAADITGRLACMFDVVGPWVVDTAESLAVCQQALRDVQVDMVLLAYQTWSEEGQLLALLQAIGSRPLVLWCYLPWRRMPHPASYAEVMRGSGSVGAFGALGTLRNLEVPFLFIFGAPDDPRLIQDLRVAGRAASARQSLRTARFGMIPHCSERMQSSPVDDTRLLADFGALVQNIPISEYQRVIEALAPERVDRYLGLLHERYTIQQVSDDTLTRGARLALGLSDLATENRLDVLALNHNTPDLLAAFGMRPALYPDLLEPSTVIYQPKGDLAAAIANHVLRFLTGSPTLFFEMWFWDEAKNQVVGGHSGPQNPALALPGQVWIGPDYTNCYKRQPDSSEAGAAMPGGVLGGAQFQLLARPGRVTLFQLRATPRGWQAIGMSGICLEGRPWVESHAHALLRLDSPIEHFFNHIAEVGATPHWIMAYGSVLSELEAYCEMEEIPLEIIQ